jgi:hypothetical protein
VVEPAVNRKVLSLELYFRLGRGRRLAKWCLHSISVWVEGLHNGHADCLKPPVAIEGVLATKCDANNRQTDTNAGRKACREIGYRRFNRLQFFHHHGMFPPVIFKNTKSEPN